MRELPAPRWEKGQPIRAIPKRVYPHPEPATPTEPSPADPLLNPRTGQARVSPPRALTPPDLNIAGIGFTGAFPPDTVGDVGPNHYIQMVNGGSGSRVRMFDKSGTRLADFELDALAPAGRFWCVRGRASTRRPGLITRRASIATEAPRHRQQHPSPWVRDRSGDGGASLANARSEAAARMAERRASRNTMLASLRSFELSLIPASLTAPI